jgi:20S proteasome alpha/beta subunit
MSYDCCFPTFYTTVQVLVPLPLPVRWGKLLSVVVTVLRKHMLQVQLILILQLLLYALNDSCGIDASTLVAIQFDSGIIIGTDSRTTSSGGSSYVSNMKNFYKVIPINRNVLIAQSCDNNYNNNDIAFMQQIVQQVKHIQQIQYLRYNRLLSVSQLAHYIRNIVYTNYNTGSGSDTNHLELLIAGIDIQPTGLTQIATATQQQQQQRQEQEQEQRCQIYTITSSGAIIQELLFGKQYVALGTGSSYITGYLQEQLCDDSNLSYRKNKLPNAHDDDDNNTYDTATTTTTTTATKAIATGTQTTETLITEKKAIEICRRAIEIAIQHDNNSGGTILIHKLCSPVSK